MERKELVKKLGEHFGVKPVYLGAPGFKYEIETESETYTIDRASDIFSSDGSKVTYEELVSSEEHSETKGISTFQLVQPLKEHTRRSLQNILNMLASKQHLIVKSLKLDEAFVNEEVISETIAKKLELIDMLEIELVDGVNPGIQVDFDKQVMRFDLKADCLTPEQITAFSDLMAMITELAKTMKKSSPKKTQNENPKYAFRTWLIRIGMNGPEFKDSRKTLLENLEGNSSFRTVKKDE